MIFGAVSFLYGIKREGKPVSHLVLDRCTSTVCGRKVDRDNLSKTCRIWTFTDYGFARSSLTMRSTPVSQLEAIRHHITCQSCLRLYRGADLPLPSAPTYY